MLDAQATLREWVRYSSLSEVPPAVREAALAEYRRKQRNLRPFFKCGACGQEFEADLKRCPVCRRKRRRERRHRIARADSYRKRISKAKRQRIYARDGYQCLACGQAEPHQLTLDHILPISKGGTNSDDNLQTLCRHCNSKVKGGGETSYIDVLAA